MSNENVQFENYFNKYINSNNKNDEFEVRFATKGKSLSKTDLNNIVEKLLSNNFKMNNSEHYSLKINPFFKDKNGRATNIRVEIDGLHNIQTYCKTNQIANSENPIFPYVKFNRKSYKQINDTTFKPIDFNEYNFRVSYQEEKQLMEQNTNVQDIISQWNSLKKTFRLIKRTSFVHDDFPFRIDCSIVKSSKLNKNKRPVYEYNLLDANVSNNVETYEVEIELLNDKVKSMKQLKEVKTGIKIILAGLQQSNFPIKLSKKNQLMKEYIKLIYNGEPPREIRISPRDFIGPASVSLEIQNIRPFDEELSITSITQNYTVTEKADGLRKLLFINSSGEVYLINMNMNVQYTGSVTKNSSLFNTIIDGEHIIHDKNGKYINLYAAFDIYILNKKELRSLPLVSKEKDYRLKYLQETINSLKLTGENTDYSPLRIKYKEFYQGKNIFHQCKNILDKEENGHYEYEIDGLIFTPANSGVGISIGSQPLNNKKTWTSLFKWKPPKYNTVDFLVTTKKDSTNNEIIKNIFESGISTSQIEQLTQYKTLELRVGFDEKKHGYLNPCQNIIDDDYPISSYKEESYKPALFYPTNPSSPHAHLAKVVLSPGPLGSKVMLTEDKTDVIEDNTIIECRYDITREEGFKWIPIRVRYDKTYEYKSGGKNYGNAYHVANSVWKTIHNPITYEMISTGKNIPDMISDDNIYYNRSGKKSETEAMRNFHNLTIKRNLIMSISKPNDTLIDTSVGKAGDMSKWIAAKLSFVFGLDISRDNIYNKMDGACARYVSTKNKYRNKKENIFDALFVQSNSSLNIRDGNACFTDKCKSITNAVFGEGTKDVNKLGKGVYKNFGKGKDGFNIVSTQFALHYFFENKNTLHSFLRNISECCKVGGYFIGTCYDGKKIFRKLESKEKGEGLTKFKNETKIWQIIKQYDQDTFENDETSLGYAVDVYQETINKVFREYLVNFDYFTTLMENYGFTKLTDEELKDFNIPNTSSIIPFEKYYDQVKNEVEQNPNKEKNIGKTLSMSKEEKYVSFLNNAFIFKKIRNVNTENMESIMKNKEEQQLEKEQEKIKEKQQEIQKEFEELEKKDKPKVRIIKKRNKKIKT